ncbi:MAG: hypothetical protein ACK559_40530, partial [bacterium]
VADLVSHVDPDARRGGRVHRGRQGERATAVGPSQGERHPLSCRAGRVGELQQGFDMRVQVDEPWRHHLAAYVDGSRRAPCRKRGVPHRRDAPIGDGHVSAPTRSTGAIHDARVRQHHVVRRRGLRPVLQMLYP